MKHFLSLLFFFLPLLLLGQTIEKSFGVELSPHWGGRRISGGGGITFTELERQDSLEMGRWGYGFGLVFESRVDKIGFTTGLRYLETGYETLPDNIGGINSGRSFSDVTLARYASIPFELNFYHDIKEKDRVNFLLGAASHLHLGTRTERTTFFDGEVEGAEVLPEDPDREYRPVTLSINTGIGFDRKLSEKWALKLQASFQFFLQGNLNATFDQTNRNYYQAGLRVTVRRLFF